MVARVRTVAFHGVEVIDVETQVTIASGLPAFTVVGLPDKAVAESRERVRAALSVLGLALPPRRITVNLAPADLLKEGSHFDLPIALGLLVAMEILPADEVMGYLALGELALDGSVTAVAGVLAAAMAAAERELGIICPAACGGTAARDPAAARRQGGARGLDHPLGRRAPARRQADARAAVPRPAPFGLAAGAGRRRDARAAGRDQPRASGRPLPRRAPRVQRY